MTRLYVCLQRYCGDIFRSQALLYILGMIYHDISEYGKMKMENEDIGRHKNTHPVANLIVKG